MEGILAMIEEPSTSEVTNFDQIDQSVLKEFLEKSTVWDFYEMTTQQYTTKHEGEKKSLILQYYNRMGQGNFCYLLFAVSDVSLRFFDELFDIDNVCSTAVLLSIINLSFVSLSDKFCSVSEALLANDSLSEFIFESGSESESESKPLEVKLSFKYKLTHF